MQHEAQICLLLEGTYPYVRGGVSSWLHQLIEGLPELSFSLVFIGGRRADYGKAHYRLPHNVVHLEAHYLEDSLRESSGRRAHMSPRRAQDAREFHVALQAMAAGRVCPHAPPLIDRVLRELERPGGLSLEQFLYSPGAWEILCDGHLQLDRDSSFIDYFWTLRWLHAPIFQLAKLVDQVPEAAVYHSISTGYAGFLGALLERRRQRPLILSEHGIYTKERRIDLNQAEWLSGGAPEHVLSDPSAPLRQLWVRYFESLGRLAYRSADPIVALFEGSRQLQVAAGAAPERTRVIKNGIDAAAFHRALSARPASTPPVIGLVGRVVPIKDVKTFVRAIGVVAETVPEVQGWVFGNTDEDPRYAEECRALVRSLGLGGRVHFFGHRALDEILPRLGVLMSSSISEGQPLVVLEAFAAGVPCVVTDVGACRELIEGGDAEDRALGSAGRVVPFADARALGQAALELLTQPETWQACQFAGLRRVRHHYAHAAMLDAYRALYRAALGA
ncbi:MAG TPA: GT4 family glycosyltransferase PelF [Polyangiales bacterium]|nr:GT4 family glycosyltransferase PelF [Polyangiales bacterium]